MTHNFIKFAIMSFGRQVIEFHRQLKPNWQIPDGIELLFPYGDSETIRVFEEFYHTFFDDHNKRTYLFGINPGRFGAGLTGIPFTDPQVLEVKCSISNNFPKRNELSSLFVYEFIDAYGGPEIFYQTFFITAICPLGFLKNGKNWNYYDQKDLTEAVKPYIVRSIQQQLDFGCNRDIAYSMGQGKNFDFFRKLNAEYQFFKEIIPLPHPRWVMQYRRKRKEEFVSEYLRKLGLPRGSSSE